LGEVSQRALLQLRTRSPPAVASVGVEVVDSWESGSVVKSPRVEEVGTHQPVVVGCGSRGVVFDPDHNFRVCHRYFSLSGIHQSYYSFVHARKGLQI
jgi:hypothetical protein